MSARLEDVQILLRGIPYTMLNARKATQMLKFGFSGIYEHKEDGSYKFDVLGLPTGHTQFVDAFKSFEFWLGETSGATKGPNHFWPGVYDMVGNVPMVEPVDVERFDICSCLNCEKCFARIKQNAAAIRREVFPWLPPEPKPPLVEPPRTEHDAGGINPSKDTESFFYRGLSRSSRKLINKLRGKND